MRSLSLYIIILLVFVQIGCGKVSRAQLTSSVAPSPTPVKSPEIDPGKPGGPQRNFAETWTLDKSKSQGLSKGMQGADSVQWVITQDGKQITIDQKITGGDMAGGAPAGGGHGFGGVGIGGPRSYNLDGSESNVEMGQGKATRKATWSSDGNTLELLTKSTFNGPNGEVTTTSTDKLQLSGDGKVLTVNRHSESPRGPQDSTFVFNKK